jgi:hypothetical protein
MSEMIHFDFYFDTPYRAVSTTAQCKVLKQKKVGWNREDATPVLAPKG